MARWECIVCGLIYDEKEGWPEDGIAPGTKWEDVPDDWTCPDCGVGKDDFELIPGSDEERFTPADAGRTPEGSNEATPRSVSLSLVQGWPATAWCASCAAKMNPSP